MRSIEGLPGALCHSHTEQPHDDEMIPRIRGGETRLFGELVRRHQDSVYGLAVRFLGSPEGAEDMAQEVFLRAYRGLDGFRGDAKFSTWLFRITFNLCADWMRRNRMPGRGITAMDALDEIADDRPDSEAEALAVEERLNVWRALCGLNEIYRSVLILRYYQDLSYEEIAAILQVPLKTVDTRAYRARKLLRETLARAEKERWREVTRSWPHQ